MDTRIRTLTCGFGDRDATVNTISTYFLCDRLVLTQFLWFFRPAQYTLPAPAAYFYTYLNDHIRSLFLLGILYHITNIRSNTIKDNPYIQ